MTATMHGPNYLDIFDPTFAPETPTVAAAQAAHWYARTPGPPLVLRYEPARALLNDQRFIHGAQGYMESHGISSGPAYDWWKNTLMSLPPEDHARVRGSVFRAFSPRRIEDLRSFARATAEHLADDLLARPTCDFTSFSQRYPSLVMCRLLGVPPGDFEEFARWSGDIGLAFSRRITPEQLPQIDRAVTGLDGYVTRLLDLRRRDPGDDLLSTLIRSRDLTAAELHNLTSLLVWGGHDTMHCQLGRAIIAFAEHPEQWDLLADRPDLIVSATEEVVRWTPQARMMWRVATEPVTLDDLHVPAGSMVLISVVAAHRDPRAFDRPGSFDITAGADRLPHLGFSHGRHHCLGAALARMQLAEALGVLVRRVQPPRIAGDIQWRAPEAAIHGPEKLPLSLTPR